MQQDSTTDNNTRIDKVNVVDKSTTPQSSNSSPTKSETETYSEHRRYMTDSSESEEDSVSEEFEEDPQVEDTAKFLLNPDEDRSVDPETQARLEALLQAAGIGKLAAKDGKHLGDPEVLRRLTSSVSCALDEAAAALTRMRSDNPRPQPQEKTSLVEACTDGDVGTVRKLLTEGRSVHETSEEGESLLSLACSAGYFELAQVLLAMHANVEDRGIKGECTPLMEAASAGHLDIVRLLVAHGADVNAQSTSGNTPLMYGCAGGHTDVVKFLLENGANVEDHNENGHTPLMEAASAGHVDLAKILLMHGAGINTHSNEFKESALTLACYKGHLDMVRFLLEAGADQEHKTDEMHTALMEASMDGHVEVARLLLDSGAQVNMPTDSFESPLTLAACGGHVDLAMLLIERGANIEEVNDEGYTPLMEAAREGHEEMVHLLLGQGANINAQTDETQETALTLACCGGFTEVADILLKGGADIELGASTPLMEAAQEGHLDLVRFLLENSANVHAQTQTGDTALTYACENGHTDVADLLLQYDADLEHESEGGRTPLMKACRAGHLCTVQFLIMRGANVRRQTTNNDHTPLSLACAGGHLSVVELLLSHNADPNHKLKDNSTMLIEAAKGGHTNVVQLLLDYPHSMQGMMMNQQQGAATNLSMLPGQVGGSRESPNGTQMNFFQTQQSGVLQEVPEAVRDDVTNSPTSELIQQPRSGPLLDQPKISNRKSIQAKNRATQGVASGNVAMTVASVISTTTESSSTATVFTNENLTSAEAQQVRTQPIVGSGTAGVLNDFEDEMATAAMEFLNNKREEEANNTLIEFIKNRKKNFNIVSSNGNTDEGSTQKQQILEELHRVERELHGKQQQLQQAAHSHVFQYTMSQDEFGNTTPNTLPHMLNIDIAMQQKQQGLGNGLPLFTGNNLQVPNNFYNIGTGQTPATAPTACLQQQLASSGGESQTTQTTTFTTNQQQQQQSPAFYFTPLPTSVAVSLSATATTTSTVTQPIKFQSVASHVDVSQNTAISDRPKAKPVSKKEGKNLRKQQAAAAAAQQQQQQQHFQSNLYGQQSSQLFGHLQIQQTNTNPTQTQQQQTQQQEILNVQSLDLDSIDQESLVLKDDAHENLLTASILQQFHNSPGLRAAFINSPLNQDKVTKLELSDKDFSTVDEVVQTLESFTEVSEQNLSQHNLQVQPYPSALDESMIASLTAAQQDLQSPTDLSRVEYFAVPTNGTQVPVHALYPYDHYLAAAAAGMPNKDQVYQAGFQAGYNLSMQQLACPNASTSETLTTTTVVPTTVGAVPGTSTQQFITPQQQQNQQQQQPNVCTPVQTACSHVSSNAPIQASHLCQLPCTQHQQQIVQTHQQQTTQQQTAPPSATQQVQAATQTSQNNETNKKLSKTTTDGIKFKKGRILRHQNQSQGNNFQPNQNYQIDHNSAITQYNGQNQQATCPNQVISPGMDVDSETESNHDTALTLACAGGHEELVELLISRGADIEHRDKKGFTPLILAATAGHEKVVDILLNHNADIEAQSERTKDTPLSLACSGGRYEVVELLLDRNANKEHRNVSDYTPLSLAASGGYVNIIKLLLSHGAEINSRTGSKLGISPLMLAAMNGHTAAVKLLLDMGSDINAQIETNRNTALTLACFQGRHEVVSLLLDRKANVEHRAKTGLTPLMEAASGGYVEVGRVLLDKGADVNATPVPSSRDTALTIAADKGHVRFVELLLCRGAQVEVKNKKGNSPLWLAANGGHLPVVELLYNVNADIDSQDNRKVSCLMAAFRKGHVKVVKWMVHHVTQFPSDQEMIRYISTVSDKELLDKCHECVKIIRAAKETQAAKANKNASILLEELDMEKTREESKRLAAARRRERKKKKKLEKKEERRKLLEENKKNENYDEKETMKQSEEEVKDEENHHHPEPIRNVDGNDKEEGDSGIDANSQGSCSSNDIKSKEKRNNKKKKKTALNVSNVKAGGSKASSSKENDQTSPAIEKSVEKVALNTNKIRKNLVFEATKSPADRDDFEATGNEVYVSNKMKSMETTAQKAPTTSPKQATKRDEGWKEVVRKSSVQTVESGVKKVSVPLNAISRVIGRGGSNINAIRGATGAHIEVEKQSKGQGERIITIKGSLEATKQAHNLIAALIKDPDVDILQMLPKASKIQSTVTTLWDKTQIGTKKNVGKVLLVTQPSIVQTKVLTSVTNTITARSLTTTTVKLRGYTPIVSTRVQTAPRLVAQAEKNQTTASNTVCSTPIRPQITPNRTNVLVANKNPQQTFAAKLTEPTITTTTTQQTNQIPARIIQNSNQSIVAPPQQAVTVTTTVCSPIKNSRPIPTASAPPTMQHFPTKQTIFPSETTSSGGGATVVEPINRLVRSLTPNIAQNAIVSSAQTQCHNADDDKSHTIQTPSEYSLFYTNDHHMWRRTVGQESQKTVNFAAVTGGGVHQQSQSNTKFINEEPPVQVDAAKAPGYRGGVVCSPVSSKTSSSNSTTPPNSTIATPKFQSYQTGGDGQKQAAQIPPIGRPTTVNTNAQQQQQQQQLPPQSGTTSERNELYELLKLQHEPNLFHANAIQSLNFTQSGNGGGASVVPSVASMSRLNPKAPDFSSTVYKTNPSQQQQPPPQQQQLPQQQIYNGFPPTMNLYQKVEQNYSRTSQQQQQQRWLMQQMPTATIQPELITGMAGMTLQNIARAATGGEILENGTSAADLIVNNSPTMSPNLPTALHHHDNGGGGVTIVTSGGASYVGVEERKTTPQPIGTERARKTFTANPIDTTTNWMIETNKVGTQQQRWPMLNEQFSGMGGRGPMYEDLAAPIDFTRMPLDSYTNGPPYFNHQVPAMSGVRHDYLQMDHLPWDTTRPNIADLQEKPQGWTNKWSQ